MVYCCIFNCGFVSFLIVFDWEKFKTWIILYIMCEQYRTICRAWFSSITAHACQHCTMCNNKSFVPEFFIWPITVSLYNYSIPDTYIFMFIIQSMIVTPSSKAKSMKKMTCYFYYCGFLFGTNILIDRIIVLFEFMQSSYSCSPKYWFIHHI